jgi:polysaccharide export outer membrane protein
MRWLVVAVSIIAVAAGHVHGQASAPQPEAAELLRPGDVVQLRIWREQDLSGEFPVDQAGDVVFPKIGVQKVTEQTPESLRDRLLEQYQRYLRNPSIEIVFLRRVTILGAVRKPGLYTIEQSVTIADALATAGGTTPEGDPDKLEVLRGGEKLLTKLSQRTRIADSPIRSGDQLFVPERTWARRNSNTVAMVVTSVISAAASLAIALIISQ